MPFHVAIGVSGAQFSAAVPRSLSLAASSALQSATRPVLDLSGTASPHVSDGAVAVGIGVAVGVGVGVAAGSRWRTAVPVYLDSSMN